MARKPSHYVVAELNGIDTELFRISEHGKHNLILKLRHFGPISREGDGGPRRVTGQHMTVHESLGGARPATTINLKTDFEDGEEQRQAAYIVGDRANLLWPAFSTTVASPEPIARAPREKDTIVRLPACTLDATPCLHVFVGGPDQAFAIPALGLLQRMVVRLPSYSLGVFFDAIKLPMNGTDAFNFIATAPLKVDGVAQGGEFGMGRGSFSPEEASAYLRDSGVELSRQTAPFHRQAFGAWPEFPVEDSHETWGGNL